MTDCSVLITAGSRRVALVRAFKSALGTRGLTGSVIVTDVNPLSPAVHVADRAYRVPMSSAPGYLDELRAICRLERIRLVVPTIDDELPLLGAAREQFAAAGVMVACSDERTNRLCDDKHATCLHLRTAGVAAARSYLPSQIGEQPPLPAFIKPRVGRGAVGAYAVRSRRELDFFLEYVSDPVVQEMLDGPEFTIDVLCGADGRPLSIVPRERVVIRAGVIDRGRTVRDFALITLAEQVCRAFAFRGPINIQCRMRGQTATVFEINPRFSGGIPLTIAAGADFPAMLVDLAVGHRVEPRIGAFQDGLWMTSYESSLFLEPGATVRPEFDARPPLTEVA